MSPSVRFSESTESCNLEIVFPVKYLGAIKTAPNVKTQPVLKLEYGALTKKEQAASEPRLA